MPATKQPSGEAPKPKAKAASKVLTNSELLKLAGKNRPPQSWYDDQTDPTQPAASNGRGK